MRDWVNTYGRVRKYQAGGPMAPPEAAPAGPEPGMEGGGGGGELEAMLAEYAQTRDPQLAVEICDQLVDMMMGGGAPAGPEAGPGPEAMPPEGAPMGRRGMKLRRGPIFRS